MPAVKKITKEEYNVTVETPNKNAAIAVYGMTDTTECKCVFSAPASLLKHFTLVLEWLMFVPDSLNIEFDHIAVLLANTMPKRRYITIRDDIHKGFIIGIPYAKA